MMVFIHVAVAVLCLLTGGHSAPVTSCEDLIRPIEIQGRDQLLGKWTLVSESTTVPGSKMLTKMLVESAWVKVTVADESDALSVFQAQKMFGRCFTLTSKMTLKNSTLSMVRPVTATQVLLNTGCPDCLVVYSNYTIGESIYSGLQFTSRRRKVSAAELEEFKKQVDCLNLPSPAILDPEKGFCPDESPSQETEATDLTNVMNEMGSDTFSLLERLFNSTDAVNAIFRMISSSVSGLKED
ncbi:uncharacterized protein LOC127355148 [Dicentrarchus labrax]|uniref:uncharacterized protein LOC127355148 n=1 Tax=Dicentrarchus labrax TaxID=13489 RepID=UPI0021F65CC1|nr:uncharacterized protein LOC127355148 [Dicentrarchus labrax]